MKYVLPSTRSGSMMAEEKENHASQAEDIPAFFKNSTIFLTGATGFLGHVLLAKLLRSCPGIRKIYILIREKKNRDVEERFKEIFNAPIFTKVNTDRSSYLNKVAAIKGDCLKPNLGISETDQTILENEINVVFHVAATVRFDEPLKEAASINVRSTQDLIKIAKNMKQLKVFVHVSTAFSFCAERKLIEEKIYDPPMPAKNLISLMDQLDEPLIERITSVLLEPHPNTYVFTKAVAEGIFSYESLNLPICIFRPAIVISTAKEPIPGWINNIYGPTGIVAAAGIGLMRSLHADQNAKANIVPCDYVINALIAAAWHTAKTWQPAAKDTDIDGKFVAVKKPIIPIYNYSSTGCKNSLTWKKFMDENAKHEPAMPFSKSIWSYSMTLNRYKLVNQLYVLLFHLLPALIGDKIDVLAGKKPRLWESYQKIHKLANVISYFSTRQWIVSDHNIRKLWHTLNEVDKKTFYFNLEDLDWTEYFFDHLAGIREFIIKDSPETIPYAIKRRRKLFITHYTVLSILVCSFTYFTYLLWRLFS